MGQPNKLQAIEERFNKPLTEIIPELLNELGTQQAVADRLGVTLPVIWNWCKTNGITRKVTWELERA